ncbi:hypothetical protein KD050_14675 [Psychrobacillus sp. INOP01]|uniref:hypothetical protein n=1 Tax=Psychrobacillus sp. INOP01 TaxID=2829187 RepID=UPI001BA9BE5B|nr:hypothetical protein [Psychrobacillus sp. INOP01]QUG40534.1 hypothetical protein KD050_14675 [Psychrobacillus sp. INOP01]
MDYRDLLKQINNSMEKLDLISARKYIEQNLELVGNYRHLLRSNGRALFDFLRNEKDSGREPLDRREMTILYSINRYASSFDIRGLKLLVNNYPDLLMRQEIQAYLNDDALTLLESLNVIQKNQETIPVSH